MNKKKSFLILVLILLTGSLFAQVPLLVKNKNIQIEYSSLNDSLFIYYLDAKGKKTPVIDLVEYAYSTYIGVLIDGKYYNLKESSGIDTNVIVDVDSNIITFENKIGNKVKVNVIYQIKDKNILNIKYDIESIDKKNHNVSIKSIFDTVLGERRGGAYTTAVKTNIDSEYVISDLNKHKRLISTDGKIGISFILNDKIESSAYKVVIAAKPYFHKDGFETEFIEGRGFNTILSYNNSSVGFFFKQKTVSQDSSATIEQNIKFSGDVVKLYKDLSSDKISDEFEDEEAESEDDDGVQQDNQEKEEVIQPKVDQPKVENTEQAENLQSESVKQEPLVQTEEQEKGEELVQPESVEPESAEPKVEEVKKSKIDKEYALEIIKRIKELEDDGSNTNRIEIIKLQTELNMIIKQLEE